MGNSDFKSVADIEGSLADYNYQVYAGLMNSYEEFLWLLYKKIDEIVSVMQKSRPSYAEQGEVPLTEHIKDNLISACGFDATVTEINGATDLTVKWTGQDWLWIGEAKLDDGYAYVLEGFKQLTTRYATAEQHEREGGVIVYCKEHPLGDFVETMRSKVEDSEYLEERNLTHHDIRVENCSMRSDYSFFTDSKLPQIGGSIRYRARFIHVGLLHTPEDKSARKSKKYKTS